MTSDQQKGQAEDAKHFEEGREYRCPDCGGQAHYMGIDFSAPKRRNVKAWRQAQAHIETGKLYVRGTR